MKWFTRHFLSRWLEKGLVFVTVGNFVSMALGALLWFILAARITAADYGSLNYYISLASIFTSLGIMGFDSTLPTFVAKGLSKMAKESSCLVFVAGLILSIILSLMSMPFSTILVLLGMIFFTFSTSEILGRRLYKEFMIISILQKLTALVFVLVFFNMYGVNGALFGYGISYLLLSYRFFLSLKEFTFSLSTLRPHKTYFFHSYILGISKTLPYVSDKLIIMPLFGVILLGYYQFGIQMLTLLEIIPLIIYNYLLPQEASGNNTYGSRLQLLGIFSAILLTVILIAFVPVIITNFFPSFQVAVFPTQITLLAAIPLTMVAIYNSLLMAREKSFHVAMSSGVFIVTQFLLILILGNLYGLIGLSLSMVIASAAQTIYLLLLKRRV